ncbi:MAG: zinc finger domain-containing protein [Euryarchaeota archaeon]|nr:zinc finger domain-containing protein [Euryarchaeota archaeon]
MRKAETCITCGKGLLEKGSTTLPCPTCEIVIGRCSGCREQSIKYVCPKCGCTGP